MKFLNIFKKELREMLSAQTILLLVMLIIIMALMGQLTNDSFEESQEESSKIALCDLDDTDFTRSVIAFLENPYAGMKNEVQLVTAESGDYTAELERTGLKSLIIIPEGFTESIDSGAQAQLIYVSRMTSTSVMSNVNIGSETAVSLIEAAVKSALYTSKVSRGQLTEEESELLESPINLSYTTIVDDKTADVSQLELYSAVYSQSLMLPLIVYLLILLGSQSMINAVTAEKLDKTLETLLSAPVSRLSVLSAKMLAAAAVAFINALVYLIGMSRITNSMNMSLSDEYGEIVNELGLSLTPDKYILIGIQMLLSMLIALSLSMILGAFAKNVKSSQTLLMPVLIITIIPFIIAMFTDISSLPGAVKYLLYLIPFTHTFIASDSVIFGNTALYIGGAVYQAAALIILMTIAVKIYTGDRIFTASESLPGLSGKRRNKKLRSSSGGKFGKDEI